MDKILFHDINKPRIFYNISFQPDSCSYLLAFLIQVFHIYFCRPYKGTYLRNKDVIKNNRTPKGEEVGGHVQCLASVTC